jgi:hypothetical protein
LHRKRYDHSDQEEYQIHPWAFAFLQEPMTGMTGMRLRFTAWPYQLMRADVRRCRDSGCPTILVSCIAANPT